MTNEIGVIKRWTARDLWSDEARFFNPWLAQNLDVLDTALGPEWTLTEGEVQQAAGNLWVDVVARTSGGQTACIEAQFGVSNHDHLGKLLTYIAAYDARVAVWIAEDPRPEHVKAVITLNSKFQDVDFYLLRLEVISIDDSGRKAPLLSRVVGPSPLIRRGGGDHERQSEVRQQLHEFWQGLAPLVFEGVPRYKGRIPGSGRWWTAPTGRRGMIYRFGVRQHEVDCALTIRGGRVGESEPVLAELRAHQSEIEAAFGGPLEWLEASRSHVRVALREGGYLDDDRLASLYPHLADTMSRFIDALDPYVAELRSRPAVGAFDEEDEDEEGEP